MSVLAFNEWLAIPLVVLCFVVVGVFLVSLVLGSWTLFHWVGQKLVTRRQA
jgi:hypothetical protein